MAYRIFLSYSRNESSLAHRINEQAKLIGFNVYLFEHDVEPGKLVAAKIKRAIERSAALVVLLTRKSQFSVYVQQEIGLAEGLGKPTVPIVETGVKKKNLGMLEGREYICLDSKNPEHALSKLVKYLGEFKRKQLITAVVLGFSTLVILALLAKGK